MGYAGNNVSDTILNWPANTFNMSVHSNDVTGSIALSIDSGTGNLSMGTVDTSDARLTIDAGNTGNVAISFKQCDVLNQTTTTGRSLQGYLRVNVENTSITNDNYYIPLYS
jgi:hypothetical protein